MPISEAFNLAEEAYGTLGSVGHYNTPKDVHGEYRGGTIGASPVYSFTAHVAEMEVDEETGFVDVTNIWVAHDCGRALNPVLVEGQMEGSAYMGFGEALMEEQAFKSAGQGKAGLHNAPSLLDYRMPTTLDTPDLHSLIVESVDPEGPYGAKEAGEGPLHPSDPGHRERHLRRRGRPARLAPLLAGSGLAGAAGRPGPGVERRRRSAGHIAAPGSRRLADQRATAAARRRLTGALRRHTPCGTADRITFSSRTCQRAECT